MIQIARVIVCLTLKGNKLAITDSLPKDEWGFLIPSYPEIFSLALEYKHQLSHILLNIMFLMEVGQIQENQRK